MTTLSTPLCSLLGIKHPIILAGMGNVANPDLAAAVGNAGGLACMGGVNMSPKWLRSKIHELKDGLKDKNAPIGIDLLLPAVGGKARKTNKDYTGGQLDQLLDIIIEEKVKLFVCAVGVCPKPVVERLHKAGILCMNMVGSPKHVRPCLDAGVDLICAQGSEAGGHTGDIGTLVLIPACVDICKGARSPLTGEPVYVVAAGGIGDGRQLAACLMNGAVGGWIGTRFVAAEEAGASRQHQDAIVKATHDVTTRTLIFTGRPLRVLRTPLVDDWETNRSEEIKKLTSQGVLPVGMETEHRPHLAGQISGSIKSVEPAGVIVERMVKETIESLQRGTQMLQARL